MATRFNVYLKIHSPRGAFEGRLTKEPLEKAGAAELMANYMGMMSRSKSRPLTMPTTEPGSEDMLVFPMEVLNQSVLRFYSMAVMESADKLDFGAVVLKKKPVDQDV